MSGEALITMGIFVGAIAALLSLIIFVGKP